MMSAIAVNKADQQEIDSEEQPVFLINEKTETYQQVLLILGGGLVGLFICGCIYTVVRCLRSLKLKNTRITSETGTLLQD